MNKKKVDSILKGITVAGISIGGVSSIQGADMVMAAIDESAADSNSLVDEGSLSESEWTEYSESTTQSMSEATSASTSESASVSESISTSESSSANKSAKQSDAVQTSESISENDSYVTTEEPAGADISVASIVSDVTYASVEDNSVGNATYNSLEEVIEYYVKDLSKTVYKLDEDKVLVRNNNDGNGVVYYSSVKDGTIKKLNIDAKAIKNNGDGTVTVRFNGYYIDGDGTWKNTTFTDYNEDSGDKVFIHKNFVVGDGEFWKEVRVTVNGKSCPVEYYGEKKASNSYSYVLIRVNGNLYFLDGAQVKEDGNFYAAEWNWFTPKSAKKDVKLIGNVRYENSYKKIENATSSKNVTSESVSMSNSAGAFAACGPARGRTERPAGILLGNTA